MTTFLMFLAIIAATAADVAHLADRVLPQERSGQPSSERVETTIEKHEVIELPTQIQIIKDGQPIYGAPSMSTVELAMMSPMAESMRLFVQPSQETANFPQPQSDGVPYEMAMRSYLPPVLPETTTTEMPFTTTTTELAATSSTSMVEEETTILQPSTLAMTTTEKATAGHIVEATQIPTNHSLPPAYMQSNQYIPPIMPQKQYLNPYIPQDQYLLPVFVEMAMAKNQKLPPVIPPGITMQFQMAETQTHSPATPRSQYHPLVSESQYLPPTMTADHILPSPMPGKRYLLPSMPENKYLPPGGMMLPPPPPMPQPSYQQYHEQLVRDQQLMYRKEQINSITDVISQMDEQLAQMQPVAPVEPAHSFSEDEYHYKTDEEDLIRFRYRR